MINQREVRVDTEDFSTALRAAMRQDPDVILVGEMRDVETVRAALAASETGHFRHVDAAHDGRAGDDQPHHRLLPPHEQKQVRLALASALRGTICQRLVQRADGEGRCVAMEICVNTGRVADAIADPDKTSTMTPAHPRGRLLRDADLSTSTWSRSFRDGVITLDESDVRLDEPARPHRRAAPPRPRRLVSPAAYSGFRANPRGASRGTPCTRSRCPALPSTPVLITYMNQFGRFGASRAPNGGTHVHT